VQRFRDITRNLRLEHPGAIYDVVDCGNCRVDPTGSWLTLYFGNAKPKGSDFALCHSVASNRGSTGRLEVEIRGQSAKFYPLGSFLFVVNFCLRDLSVLL
jgi:hypothetical protein